MLQKMQESFLVRHSCRQAFKDFGWCVFFAYSDSDAGEIGTIYQAVGWEFIGEGLGRPAKSYHTDYESPDGKMIVSSYKLNHDKKRTFVRSLGWDESKGPMRPYLESLGWKPIKRYGKKKWAWFERAKNGQHLNRLVVTSLCHIRKEITDCLAVSKPITKHVHHKIKRTLSMTVPKETQLTPAAQDALRLE